VNSATCSMTIAAAVHAAAIPAAHRLDLYAMRETRSVCLEHRVATFGLLCSHHGRPPRRAIVPQLVVSHHIQVCELAGAAWLVTRHSSLHGTLAPLSNLNSSPPTGVLKVRCRSACLPRCARCDVTGTAQLGARAVVQWCLPQLRLPTASSCAVPGRRALTSRPGTQPRCGPGCNPRRLRRRRARFPRKLSVLIRYSNIS
jgi:hypothetical protein